MNAHRSPWRLSILAVALLAVTALAVQAQETTERRDARMKWWREARFGMFIHWGLYAIPAGEWNGQKVGGAGEWIMYSGQIQPDEYEKLAPQFNPVKFNARQWVRIAKAAGMKYIVITSKHHDGFCLWDSAETDYDVIDATPFGRDILKELADECHRQGLKMCFYHSILDWHHPDYLPRGEGSPRPWDKRPTEGADLNRYIDHMKAQLRELLTKYGEIGVIWFDGGWEHSPEELRSEEVVSMMREAHPSLIINNRIQIPQDFDTPEQQIPATGIPGRDWETCMTMNDTWGYRKDDRNWKSTEDLIRKLADIASKGGNFLLNVGPTSEGLIPAASVERLAQMGAWLQKNGESVYDTTASPFKALPWGRCTQRPGKLYLHVFEWPNGLLQVPGLKTPVKKAYLLADRKRTPLAVTPYPDFVGITLPVQAPDPVDTVVVLEVDGEVVIDTSIRQQADGSFELKAADAVVHGDAARYESGPERDNIGFWTKAEDFVTWDITVDRPGRFEVEVTYACEPAAAGAEYIVEVGGKSVSGKVADTGGWGAFKGEKLGVIEIADGGLRTVTVRPTAMPGFAVMNLRGVVLRPAP